MMTIVIDNKVGRRVNPRQGLTCPEAISIKVMPTDHMSAFFPYPTLALRLPLRLLPGLLLGLLPGLLPAALIASTYTNIL